MAAVERSVRKRERHLAPGANILEIDRLAERARQRRSPVIDESREVR